MPSSPGYRCFSPCENLLRTRATYALLLAPFFARAAEPVVRDLGGSVAGVSWGRLHPGATADGKASLLLSFGQNNGGLFVADVNLATGHCTQYAPRDPAASTFPTASFRSLLTGALYLGPAWDGHLHRFDPAHAKRGLEYLGKLDDEATLPTGIAEAPDRSLWIGTYPQAHLIRYEPAAKKFTRFGPMDPADQYLYPLAGDDGSVAALLRVSRPHLVLIDPATGEHREAGPATTDVADKTQRLNFYKATDRRLYLDTHAGKFRVQGLLLVPTDDLPPPLAGIHAAGSHRYQAPLVMPGGWTAAMLDDDGAPRRLLLANSDPRLPSRVLTLDWRGGGSNLHVIEPGPDGALYGSAYLPNRLFRATPDGSTVEDLERAVHRFRHVYQRSADHRAPAFAEREK